MAHPHDSPVHSFTVFQNTQTRVALILTNFLKYTKHSKSPNVINPIRCRPTYISSTQVEGIARGQRITSIKGIITPFLPHRFISSLFKLPLAQVISSNLILLPFNKSNFTNLLPNSKFAISRKLKYIQVGFSGYHQHSVVEIATFNWPIGMSMADFPYRYIAKLGAQPHTINN